MAASTATEGPDRLVSEIKEALPDIKDSCRTSLMQAFAELGVKSEEDALMLAEPHRLVEILGADDAKKLIAHFNKQSSSMGLIVTDGGWDIDDRPSRVNNEFQGTVPEWCMALLQALVNAEPKISAACRETSASLHREQEKRNEIMQDTLRYMDEKITQTNRIHEDTVEGLKTCLSRTTQAHEKMLQDLREEEARFAKAMEEKRERRRKLEEEQEHEIRQQREEQERRKQREETECRQSYSGIRYELSRLWDSYFKKV